MFTIFDFRKNCYKLFILRVFRQTLIWRKLTLEITSKLGEHTTAKLRYLAPLSHERMYIMQ